MKISFKGIKDIYIGQSHKKDQPQIARLSDGSACRTTADIDLIRLKCILDDKNNRDLNDYYIALAKIDKKNNNSFLKYVIDYDSIDLISDQRCVKYGDKKFLCSRLLLNGEDLGIHDDSTLALYSFLAYLTRTIAASENTSVPQRKLLTILNQEIANKACRYLDIKV